MKTVDFMDKYQVRRVRDMIASETTKIRFVDLPGSVDTDEKRNNRPCLMRTVYRFLLDTNGFLIEYVYNEYEHILNYRLLRHQFHIIDASKISSKTNWLIDNNAIYNAVIGSWDNLNSQDKNVYDLGATAIIKYANYVAQSLANIKRYESDIKNGKSEFDCDFPKEQKPRFKNNIINRPTFLINLPGQLDIVCH
ncbi:MAG: hypothetical protein II179_02325 [Alphaproteobacteria bacterium]|nr:hypothetical protein [Alphaproteobacteria bacterium]